MIVYHTSPVIVDNPDTHHSREFVDFGKGFYLTPLKEQAVKYAERFIRRNREAWLNVYQLEFDMQAWKVLQFDHYDEVWLDFVVDCRKGVRVEDYDLIIGGIANDRVFHTIDLYFAGEITKEAALKRLIYERPNIQYCIRSEKMLKECLIYHHSIRL